MSSKVSNRRQEDHLLLTQGPILQAIKQIAVPMLFMMLAAVTFNNIDARYISLISPEALNGFNILFPFLTLSSAMIYGGLGTGISAMVSRSFAQKDDEAGIKTIRIGLFLVTGLCLLFALIFILFAEPIFNGLTSSPEALKAASDYSLIYFSSIFFMGWGAVFAAGLRGTGNAKKPAQYSIFVMVLNFCITPIFCYAEFSVFDLFSMKGFSWGIHGAALSSVLSSFILCALLARDLFHENPSLIKQLFIFQFEKQLVQKILVISFIAMLMPMMNSLLTAFVIRMLHFRGDAFVDAFSLAKRFELALIMLIVSLGNGVLVVAGANHAIGKKQRVKEAVNCGLKILFCLFVPLLILMAFGSSLWFKIFTNEAQVLQEGAVYFIWAGPAILFTSAIILINFAFQGLTLPQKPLPYTMISIILFQGLGALILKIPEVQTSHYFALASLSATLCFVFVYRLFFKELENSQEQS